MPDDATFKDRLRDFLDGIEQLEAPEDGLGTTARMERFEQCKILCEAALKFRREFPNSEEAAGTLERLTDLEDELEDQLLVPEFWDVYSELQRGELARLEVAVEFLEADPWFFRSGYFKADLLRYIARLRLTDEYRSRLRKVILAAIDFRDRCEFRWYCKLARAIQNNEFRNDIERRLTSSDSGIRRRARWVLSAITHNETFHIRRGVKKYWIEGYAEAVGDFSRAIHLEPDSVRALLWRGKANVKAKQFSAAIEDFTKLIALSGLSQRDGLSRMDSQMRRDTCEACKWRGWIYAQLNQYDLAEADFQNAIDLLPNDWYRYRGFESARLNRELLNQATENFSACIKLLPGDAEAQYLLGLVYGKSGKHSSALTTFERAHGLTPNDLDTLIWLSRAHFALGQYQDAHRTALTAQKIDGHNAMANCCLGKALYALGCAKQATTELTKSIDADPQLWAGEHYYWRSRAYSGRNQEQSRLDHEVAIDLGFRPSGVEQNYKIET